MCVCVVIQFTFFLHELTYLRSVVAAYYIKLVYYLSDLFFIECIMQYVYSVHTTEVLT